MVKRGGIQPSDSGTDEVVQSRSVFGSRLGMGPLVAEAKTRYVIIIVSIGLSVRIRIVKRGTQD